MKRIEDPTAELDQAQIHAQKDLEAKILDLISTHPNPLSEAKTPPEELQIHKVMTGMNNRVFKITLKSDPSKGQLIVKNMLQDNTSKERAIIYKYLEPLGAYIRQIGYGPKIFHRDKKWEIQEFKEGELLSLDALLDEEITLPVAKLVAGFSSKLKNCPLKLNQKNRFCDMLDSGIKQSLQETRLKWQDSPRVQKKTLEILDEMLKILEDETTIQLAESFNRGLFPFVVSHNDPNVFNILKNAENGEMTLLDYEDSTYNPICYDVAYIFAIRMHTLAVKTRYFRSERAASQEAILRHLEVYLENLDPECLGEFGGDVEELLGEDGLLFKAFQGCLLLVNLTWLCWCVFRVGDEFAPFNWDEYMQSRIDMHEYLIKTYFSA